jgi:hypothetical protein
MGPHETEKLLSCKITINMTKWQLTKWKKIFKKHMYLSYHPNVVVNVSNPIMPQQ